MKFRKLVFCWFLGKLDSEKRAILLQESTHKTDNKIQKRNNKLYIIEESSHTWLKYTCRMCKVCLFIIIFLVDFQIINIMSVLYDLKYYPLFAETEEWPRPLALFQAKQDSQLPCNRDPGWGQIQHWSERSRPPSRARLHDSYADKKRFDWFMIF